MSASANPTEDQQIAQQLRIQAANQAVSDYQTSSAPDRQGLINQLTSLGLSAADAEQFATRADAALQQQLQIRQTANQAISDYQNSSAPDRQGLINQLQSLGYSQTDAAKYADQADQAVQQRLTTADVMSRYSKIDPEFGTPQLDRNTAIQQMVAAGVSSDRANELLNGIDAQNAIKLENRLGVQSAYQNFVGGKGSEEALRSAMTSAGYTDKEIDNLVLRGRVYLEGSKLTAGEQAQQRGELLPDIRAEAAAKPTFAEAYALVRDKLGPGATFTWQGKEYVASSAAERPDLTAAGMAAKAMQGDPQFQVALSETAAKNQQQISQVFSEYTQSGSDLSRDGALSRLEKLGVNKDQASFYLDQADGKLPLLYDQFKAQVPTANEDSYKAYILAFTDLKNKGVPTSLLNISGYGASGARPNMPALINGISTAFGMGAEAAGNTLTAFGTVGEALGLNTAKMSDFGRRLEKIGQEMYPQALTSSENEVKARFANASTGKDLAMAVVDSVVNNPGAVLKMIGVEGIQEIPNIALALSTGGASAVIRYGGILAGLGLDVVESAGGQGAQKIDEGLQKGLSRTAAVKNALDDMKAAGAITTIVNGITEKIPFGGTLAKTIIKGSASEAAEEYLIARATGQSHFDALRAAAFASMIGGPTEGSLEGAGKLTNVVVNGNSMVGTYENGIKVTISEPSGATELKIDITQPSIVASHVTSDLTSSLNSGVDLSAAINNVVKANIGSDFSGTIDSSVKVLVNNNADLTQGVSDLTSSALTITNDTKAVINQVVGSLASNNVDLNANAGSVVVGALKSGASLTNAVTNTLTAVTKNGGTTSDSASSIIDSVSNQTGGDLNAVTTASKTIINSSNGDKTTVAAVITAASNATNGNSGVVTDLVASAAKTGNTDTTAAAVNAAIQSTNGAALNSTISSALNNGANASNVLSTAANTLVAQGNDAASSVSSVISAAASNNVDTKAAVTSAVTGALSAGGDATAVVTAAVDGGLTSKLDAGSVVSATVTSALNNGADASTVISSAVTAAVGGSQLSTETATVSAVSSAVTAGVKSGADTAMVVNAAVSAAVTNSGGNQEVIASSLQTSVAAATTAGGNVSTVVSSAVNTAVNNGVNSTTAAASAVAGVIATGGNVNAAVEAARTSSGVQIATSVQGSRTMVTATDGNTVTKTVVDTTNNVTVTSVTDLSTNQTISTVSDTGAQQDISALQQSVASIQTNLNNKIQEAIKTGQTADAAITSSVQQVASDLGITKDQLLDQIGKTEAALKTDVKTLSDTVTKINTDLSTEIKNNLKTTQDANAVLDQSINKVASDLGITKDQLLDQIGKTETQLKTEIQTTQDTITQVKTDLTTQINTLAKTTGDADKIIKDSIQKVANDLGISKAELLDKIGETETSLKAELATELAKVSQEFNKQMKSLRTALGTSAALAAAQPIRGISLDNDWLKGQMLKAGKAEGYRDPLAEFQALQEESQKQEMLKQIDPELANVLAERGTPVTPYYSYGEEQPIEDVLGMGENKEEAPVFRSGGLVSPLNIQMMYAKGGRMREDFRHGKHVEGEGDGQSDNIPAWLADGEFVFPADVVSALGNGSTKAGTDKLYEMMHAIRDRARSKGPKDLPPPALKSPLDYLKKGR